MKFAKILFIVGAFALLGLTLSSERTERLEAQYQASTQSLKVEVGYKEILTPPNEQFNEKVLERDYKGVVTYRNKRTEDFVLQTTMIKEGAFRSGIPFSSANSEKFSSPGFSQIFVAVPGQDKVQYVPFVQLTQNCLFDIAVLPLKMNCPVKTNVGAGMLGFEFIDLMDTEALTIVDQINKLKNFRESEINRTVVTVLDAITRLKAKQEELKSATTKIADAFKKQNDKQKNIIKLIRKQGEIDDQITAEADRYKTLTKNVEKASKRISEINQMMRSDISQKVSVSGAIKNLQSAITGPAQIAKLESDLQRFGQLVRYWIQGAVFHRIIDDNEAKPLEEMVVRDGKLDAFNSKLDDYFYPQ